MKSGTKKHRESVSILHFNTIEEWMNSPISMDLKSGKSPGGTASQLGVSRQVLYRWAKLGFLDWIDVADGTVTLISSESARRVEYILAQLREEWDTDVLQGYQVIAELEKRLPQLDMFQDL